MVTPQGGGAPAPLASGTRQSSLPFPLVWRSVATLAGGASMLRAATAVHGMTRAAGDEAGGGSCVRAHDAAALRGLAVGIGATSAIRSGA